MHASRKAWSTVFLLLAFWLSLACPAGAAERLRVLSLNAEWFPGREPDAAPAQQARHIVAMQRLLHDLNPDLWLVQEVNDAAALPKALSVLPGTSVYIASQFKDSPQQLALAGRLPCLASEIEAWAGRSKRWREVPPPRGIAFCAVEFSDRSLLLVFTMHLKSNFRGGETYDEGENIRMREASAQLFLEYAERVKTRFTGRQIRGMLLGGDMNVLHPYSVYRSEKTVRILEKGGFAHLGSSRLDHFWGAGIPKSAFKVFSEYDVSDHQPVVLDIQLPDGITVSRLSPLEPAAVVVGAGYALTNINTASLQELLSLPGIGPVLAQRIISQRPFGSEAALAEACGIGPATLSKIRPCIERPVLPGGK